MPAVWDRNWTDHCQDATEFVREWKNKMSTVLREVYDGNDNYFPTVKRQVTPKPEKGLTFFTVKKHNGNRLFRAGIWWGDDRQRTDSDYFPPTLYLECSSHDIGSIVAFGNAGEFHRRGHAGMWQIIDDSTEEELEYGLESFEYKPRGGETVAYIVSDIRDRVKYLVNQGIGRPE